MSDTVIGGFTTELPSRQITTTALMTPAPVDALPSLKPLPQQQTGTNVVAAAPPKRGWLSFGMRRAPRDPDIAQAYSVTSQVAQLKSTLTSLHDTLASNTNICRRAPHHWQELVTPYNVARASAIAMLNGLAARLDLAAQQGATAALSQPSRALFESAVNDIRVADVEFASLEATCETRHAEALAEADRDAQAKARVAAASIVNTEELKDLGGERRASVEDRISKLRRAGYGFARFPIKDSRNPPKADTSILDSDSVIPALALNGSLVFGKTWSGGVLADGMRAVSSVGDLVEIVDTLMGRDGGSPPKEIER